VARLLRYWLKKEEQRAVTAIFQSDEESCVYRAARSELVEYAKERHRTRGADSEPSRQFGLLTGARMLILITDMCCSSCGSRPQGNEQRVDLWGFRQLQIYPQLILASLGNARK
jgi:hypothetical protein